MSSLDSYFAFSMLAHSAANFGPAPSYSRPQKSTAISKDERRKRTKAKKLVKKQKRK